MNSKGKGLNKGGLKDPCKQIFLHYKYYFTLFHDLIMNNGYCDLIKSLFEQINNDFQKC